MPEYNVNMLSLMSYWMVQIIAHYDISITYSTRKSHYMHYMINDDYDIYLFTLGNQEMGVRAL